MQYFIYKTTNIINNKTYIGIHQTNNLNDGYLGSGLALKRAIKKHGKQNFKREILEFCSSYNELIELEKIYVNEIWIKDKSNYNLKTGGQQNGFLSEESKKKISETLIQKYFNGELKPILGVRYFPNEKQKKQISETLINRYANGEKLNSLPKEPWNKGKKGLQIGWNKGKKGLQEGWSKGLKLKPKTSEEREKQSKILKEYYKNHPHPTKGLKPWNLGKEMVKTECPYCKKMVDIGNGKRWHFDNCKLNNAIASSNCADKLC